MTARTGVMHLIGSLDAGGAERVAVDLVNRLPRTDIDAHLCTTRREGDLSRLVAAHVHRLGLAREHRYDVTALWVLVAYIRKHRITILHAHGTTIFLALAAALFSRATVVWHLHSGPRAASLKAPWYYRLAISRVHGIAAVSRPLAQWVGRVGRPRAGRVWQVPNASFDEFKPGAVPSLPGANGLRIVCVANLRPEKDHFTLLEALRHVVDQDPSVHLLLVGKADGSHGGRTRARVRELGLEHHVSLLGYQSCVAGILRSADIAVLSSAHEGLPLALLEYAKAGLPVVSTAVGECPQVLEGGRAGLLVPPQAPQQLADAILRLVESPTLRKDLGERLRCHVSAAYDPARVIAEWCVIYKAIAP